MKLARTLGISEKRLLGWEPRVVYRGYDEAGERVPFAQAWEWVAEADPEWDDQQRESMTALGIFEKGVHTCGFHVSLTKDRANHFAIEEDECLVCASMDRFERIRAEADRKTLDQLGGEKAPAGLARPSDGRITYVRPKVSPAVQALLDEVHQSPTLE